MATLRTLSEQVIRILSGGDVKYDADIDEREVMLAIQTARDSVLSKYLHSTVFCKTCPEYMETNILSSFVTKYTAKISGDAGSQGQAPIFDVLPLPDDMGVYWVGNEDSLGNKKQRRFVRVPALSISGFFRGLHSGKLEGMIPWSLHRQDGGCVLMFPTINVATDIEVFLIPLTKEYGLNEELPGGGVIDNAVMKEVLQIYGVMFQSPHDEENDNIWKLNK